MFSDYPFLLKIIGNILDSPGFGGNISIKDDKKILIKSSGEDLKNENSDCCIVNLKDDSVIGGGYFSRDEFTATNISRKPSMEYSFHKLIESKYVVHYHPVYVLPYLCSDYSFETEKQKIENLKIIDYYHPGKDLAEYLETTEKSKRLFLRNHGVIIHGDTLQDIIISYNIIKNNFFKTHSKTYTPDDYIDEKSLELWLFRHVIENIARKENIKLNQLSVESINHLRNDLDEKYRKEKMLK